MSNMAKGICVVIAVVLVLGLLGGLFAGCPKYNVYNKEMRGKAALKEAEWNKKIAVEVAIAKKNASVYEAQAEVERAKGVAEANKIIGESLKGNEGYLRYLWVQGLQDGSSEVIYIPTEAGMPLLEAGQR